MNSRKNIIAMLLLPFMIIALNSFSGSGAIYAYADEKADTPAVAEQTAHDAESETTAEPGKMITEETKTTSESVETTTEQVKTTSEPETESAAEADETVYAAFDESITVDGVKVRVTADAGVFPEGATLKVEKLKGVDREEAREAVDEETGDLDIAKEHLFDITILDKEGNEIQPEGKANVSFETSEVADETLETNVYHIKDNGKAEALDVDVNGVVAQVETTGFSPYSLIFSYTDSSGTTKSINLRVGETDQIGPVLDKIGISNASQDARGGIANAVSDDPKIVRVYEHEWAGWFLQAVAGDENEHYLTVTFKDGYEVTVKVTSHKHHWTATGDGTDALTIVCDDPQNCYYFNNVYFDDKAFTAQISAGDATYDGQPHGAEKELQQRFPQNDVTVEKDIHYVGIEGTTYADSTTAPTDAGKYKAYYQVRPQGQDDVFTVQTTYTINKADIKFDPAPAAISNLIYKGEDQELYTLGTAKSTGKNDKTFPIKYWYADDSSQKVEDEILKGKDVGTVKVSYQSEGDANHNATEVKTIEIKIGKRPVKVSGITASNKTYDGTNSATLNFDGAEFENILTGDKLTVSAKGAFADKNAGDNKTVNITDLTLGGADADKYTLDKTGQQGSTTANITAKTLKVKWQESAELPYTGEEQAPKAEFEFAQELTSDDGKAYTGDDVKPEITGKHIYPALWTATVKSLSGRDAGNYKLDTELSNVNKEYKIVPKKLTVKWTTTEKEYDAKALEPDYELTGFVGGDQPNKHLSFTADPTELVGNQAVNAGTYKATLELTGETASNYEITNPKTTFTISPRSISGASVTLDKTQLTYSGSEQSVSVTEVSLDGVKLAEADYDASGNKGTNKGDYTVKVTGKGNYKDSATADWKIVGKAMTVEAEPVTAKYDGNEYGITVNVTDPSSGTTTKFGTKEGTYDLNESPKFKSAGTHTVYFKVSGNDEYDDYTGNATVTISKKAVTASVSAEDKTYDGKTDATVSASVKAEDLIRGDSVEITGLKGSFADANAGEDKKVSVDSSAAEVSGTGSDNYVVTIPEETTASVSKAAPDVTAPGAKTLTYNGKAQGLVNAGKAKGGEMQYALGENANVAPGEGWSTDIPTGTDVGDYYVWFKVIGDDNHNNTDPVCVTVRISEKKPEPVSKATITYDLNGGTLNGKTGVVTITEDIGTVITLPAPTRDGYTFDYWEGSKYNAGDKYTVNGDHTFKAVWKTGAGGNGKGGSSKGGTKTGDPNDLAGLIALMLAAGGALGAMGYRRRKER